MGQISRILQGQEALSETKISTIIRTQRSFGCLLLYTWSSESLQSARKPPTDTVIQNHHNLQHCSLPTCYLTPAMCCNLSTEGQWNKSISSPTTSISRKRHRSPSVEKAARTINPFPEKAEALNQFSQGGGGESKKAEKGSLPRACQKFEKGKKRKKITFW